MANEVKIDPVAELQVLQSVNAALHNHSLLASNAVIVAQRLIAEKDRQIDELKAALTDRDLTHSQIYENMQADIDRLHGTIRQMSGATPIADASNKVN